MIGAIIGDIAGSRFEWHNLKSKNFELFHRECRFTDDTVMSLAVARAILNCNGNYDALSSEAVMCMQSFGRKYRHRGYGGNFSRWIWADRPQPYGSYGNGSAMRVSACGYAAGSLDEAVDLAYKVTAVTHNHPAGLKGAEAVASAVYMARNKGEADDDKEYKNKIRTLIEEKYYSLDFTLDEIRPEYKFDVTCQGSVPQAIEAFLEATSFEDAVRNAVSIGGDSDTIAAITGSIAEAYYGVPEPLKKEAVAILSEAENLVGTLMEFEERFPICK